MASVQDAPAKTAREFKTPQSIQPFEYDASNKETQKPRSKETKKHRIKESKNQTKK